MAPQTRSTFRPSTPPNVTGPGEPDTTKRTHFYATWDAREEGEGRNAFCDRTGYRRSTTSKWLKQRKELGSPAYRRTRKLSNKLGRVSKIQKKHVKLLLNHQKNPYRGQRLEVMIEYFKLGVKPQQLRRRLAALSNKARRYKAAYYKNELNPKTK